MKRLVRVGAALGITAGFLFAAAPPSSAGGPPFTVDVTGVAACLPSGQVEVTWVAIVNPPSGTGTTLEIELPDRLDGLNKLAGGEDNAVVQFDGEQSGAATGAVTFDPFQQTVPASNDSFPVESQAIAIASGETGGTVVLDVTVLIFNPLNPEEDNFTVLGVGEVELPICEQPVVTEATTAASPAAATRPRFTG
jgi:hypothetical protein